MKEVTEWDNNPREMWVWGSEPEQKRKAFVIWIKSDDYYSRVITLDKSDHDAVCLFRHCAEIEQRRMTNKELARWLREKPDREWTILGDDSPTVFSTRLYTKSEEDKPVPDIVAIREGDSPWFEPFVGGDE